jgi:Tfp pilus assembly protein PilF
MRASARDGLRTIRRPALFPPGPGLQPKQGQALYQLAEISFQQARYEEARGFLTRYVQVVAAPGPKLWLGVRVENRLGDRDSEAVMRRNCTGVSPRARRPKC